MTCMGNRTPRTLRVFVTEAAAAAAAAVVQTHSGHKNRGLETAAPQHGPILEMEDPS